MSENVIRAIERGIDAYESALVEISNMGATDGGRRQCREKAQNALIEGRELRNGIASICLFVRRVVADNDKMCQDGYDIVNRGLQCAGKQGRQKR